MTVDQSIQCLSEGLSSLWGIKPGQIPIQPLIDDLY